MRNVPDQRRSARRLRVQASIACAPRPSATARSRSQEHPDPEPQAGELLVARAGRRAQRRRHAAARGPLPAAARRAARHPRARAGRRGRRRRPRRHALRARRPRDGGRRRRRAGRARRRARARRDAGARRARLDRGRRRARGVHDRPRRALHPGRAHASASACSSTARPAASAWPRCSSPRWPARASRRRCATPHAREQIAALGRAGDRARGLRGRTGPFDVILELVGAPEPGRRPRGARRARADLHHRRRRRREGRAQPARADGQARARSTARCCARARSRTRPTPPGAWSAPCCPASPRATSACRSTATFPLDAVADAYARFQAGVEARQDRARDLARRARRAPRRPARAASAAWTVHSAGPPASIACLSSDSVSFAPHSSQCSPIGLERALLEVHVASLAPRPRRVFDGHRARRT